LGEPCFQVRNFSEYSEFRFAVSFVTIIPIIVPSITFLATNAAILAAGETVAHIFVGYGETIVAEFPKLILGYFFTPKCIKKYDVNSINKV
jgi:hypothetical protein